MSKGDSVQIVLKSGQMAGTVSATRNGRKVTVKSAGVWTLVQEETRTGKPEGSSMKVRTSEIAAIYALPVQRR